MVDGVKNVNIRIYEEKKMLRKWKETQALLDELKTPSEKLEFILNDIWIGNNIDESERYAVFVGKVIIRNDFYFIEEITTITGRRISRNPYSGLPLLAYIGAKCEYAEDQNVIFTVSVGYLSQSHELLKVKKIKSFKELGIELSAPAEIAQAIIGSNFAPECKEKLLEIIATSKWPDDFNEFIQQKTKWSEEARIAAQKKEEAETEVDRANNRIRELTEKQSMLSNQIQSMENEIRKARFFLPTVDDAPTAIAKESTIQYSEFINRIDYLYDADVVVPFLMGLCTNQIITLYGPPGKGKTTLVSKMAKAIGAKCTIVSVQSNWTDSADLLGYYSPIDKTYEGTPFVDALINANIEWIEKGNNSRLHIICLDEMNLARMEYYFATFLSLLQLDENERNIRLLPLYIEDEFDEIFQTLKENNDGEIVFDKKVLNEKNDYLWRLRKYRGFKIPPNVHFVGTINNDDTTNELSPKVRDRCLFINMSSVSQTEDRKLDITDYYPVAFFEQDSVDRKYLPYDFEDENNRFKHYAEQMLSWVYNHLPEYVDEEHDIDPIIYSYLIITKILPLLRRKDDFIYVDYPEADDMFNKRADETPGDNFDLLGGY